MPHCCKLAVHQSDSERDATLTGQKLRKRSNSFPFVRSWMTSQPILFEQREAATCNSRGKANMYTRLYPPTGRKKWMEYLGTIASPNLNEGLHVNSTSFQIFLPPIHCAQAHCLNKRINRCKLLSPVDGHRLLQCPYLAEASLFDDIITAYLLLRLMGSHSACTREEIKKLFCVWIGSNNDPSPVRYTWKRNRNFFLVEWEGVT